jgi:tetratricopeptide (TPR) repeat protein
MKYLDYIDDYFKGGYTAAKTRQFEQRLEDDPLFAEEVAFYLSTMQVLRQEARTEKTAHFRTIYEAQRTPVKSIGKGTKKLYLAAAAAVVIGLLLAVYLLMTPVSKQQMADRFIQQNLTTLGVTMGGADSLEMAKGLYNQGRFIEALSILETMVRHDSSNGSAMEYAGITSLRLAKYDKALAWFQQLSLRKSYNNTGLFYQALTLMKRNQPGDQEKARVLLKQVVDANLPKKDIAQQWLKKW